MSTVKLIESPSNLGQIAYEQYCATIGSRALQRWHELGEPVRQAWCKAAASVVETVWKTSQRRADETAP